MSRVIKINLDSSVDNGLSELEDYMSELNDKLATFIDTLVSSGVSVAGLCVSSTKGDSKRPDVIYKVDSKGDIIKAEIAIVGEDVLFVEFGAGIAYNTGAQHPQAGEFGYGIGTFPSKHPPNRAINPGYWYYSEHDSVGATVRTRSIGTEATMPIYNASETMRNEIITKAVDAFRS